MKSFYIGSAVSIYERYPEEFGRDIEEYLKLEELRQKEEEDQENEWWIFALSWPIQLQYRRRISKPPLPRVITRNKELQRWWKHY